MLDIVLMGESTRRCPGCGNIKNLSWFGTCPRAKKSIKRKGRRTYCRKCRTIERANTRAKRKKANVLTKMCWDKDTGKKVYTEGALKWQELCSEEMKTMMYNCPDGYDIDHIVPLTHDKVCGLHCPANLQYLLKSENSSKGNKLYEELGRKGNTIIVKTAQLTF